MLSDIKNALPAIKLSLLKTVWGPDWGDQAAFERWVDKGARGTPPAGLEAAAQAFRHGSDAGS